MYYLQYSLPIDEELIVMFVVVSKLFNNISPIIEEVLAASNSSRE